MLRRIRDVLRPGKDGRIDGTSYRGDRAPKGSLPFGDKAPTWRELVLAVALNVSVRIIRPQSDDVIVLRTSDVAVLKRLPEINLELRRRGWKGVVIVLPEDARVHCEPAKLKREDRGYRETATYGTDRSNVDSRGVHTGLPENLTPHPLSEGGEDDPCAPK